MSKRDDAVYFGHMLDFARSAYGKVAQVSREEFGADENLRLAVVHLVQRIGEAARRVPSATRDAHPEIPWTDIVGMRSKIVHDYFDIDFDRLWDVARGQLPALIVMLERITPRAPGGPA